MSFIQAEYKIPELPEFAGNPFIEALPLEIPHDEYSKYLLVAPPYSEEERKHPTYKRFEYLQRIAQLHIPTKEESFIMLDLRRCLNWGYVSRNPMSMDIVKNALKKHGFESSENMLHYIHRLYAPVYGFSILGISGVGKTTAVNNILNLYPQVIEHHEYCGIPFETKQLVWLKLDCPCDGTVRSFCHSIINSIDLVINENYSGKIIKNLMSFNILLLKVNQLLQSLNLGILVIDEIQNLATAKNTESRKSMSFIIELTNILKIPVIMIGSPKIVNVLNKEFQMAKRASGEGEIKMRLMEENSSDWRIFLETLWNYQFTEKKVNLTNEIKNVFFAESVGNPFIAAILYKLVQDKVILSKDESFNVADIRDVSNTMLGLTKKKRMDMLEGIDVELNSYKYLWSTYTRSSNQTNAFVEPVAEVDKKIKEDLQTTFEQNLMQKFDLEIKKARDLVKKSMAAYPNDTDIVKLMDYAEKLLKLENDKTD